MTLADSEGSRLARPRRKRERLDFALPTINVIFLLMLYFLVAGTIVQRGELSVVPPETSQVPTSRLPRPLLVISETGSATLDGQAMSPDSLVAEVAAALAGKGLPLNVLAPAAMEAPGFLELVAALGAAGIEVRLVTVERDGAAAAP